MKKTTTIALTLLAAAMLVGNARGQQAPATNAQQTPPAKAPAASNSSSKPAQAPAAKGQTGMAPTTDKEKQSYAIGVNIAKSLQKDSVSVNADALAQGIKDTLSGAKPLMTEQEVMAALSALQANVNKRQQDQMAVAGEANKKEGEAFLAANKSKQGVVTLPSGLQYKILTAGTGPKPTASDTVVCNYKGTLINGSEFDSSYKRGEPATFPVGQVIKGWTEALQLMPVGSKWQLFIPSDMAYGPRSPDPSIGPNSTLIFEVELMSIEGKK